MTYPDLRISDGQDRRLRRGSPWLFSNEVRMERSLKELPAGSVVRVISHDGKAMGVALFNPHTLIAARLMSRKAEAVIDRAFLGRRIARALALRERLFDAPFYRLIHAEADGLPGLIVDRLGDVLVLQPNIAGMETLLEPLLDALADTLAPRAIIVRRDSPVRELEGLPLEGPGLVRGTLEGPVELVENGVRHLVEPLSGQKTGWYFDQRLNRAFAARLAKGQSVLDLYSYSGSFGLAAASAGAKAVLLIDRSMEALEAASASAALQGLEPVCTVRRQEAFEALGDMVEIKQRFGLVLADPPPFARARKDVPSALKGYQKLARLCASIAEESGFLCLSSCSHNVTAESFLDACHAGIRQAGRGARLLHIGGAGPDHPIHPALPETGYLKFLAFALD